MPLPGKRKRLLELLEREAKERPSSLDRIAALCGEHRLDWPWVEEQLSKLAETGLLVFPRPWTVQLLPSVGGTPEKVRGKTDIRRDIVAALRKAGGSCKVEELVTMLKSQGVQESSVDESLDRLMHSGLIFEPKPGVVSLVGRGE